MTIVVPYIYDKHNDIKTITSAKSDHTILPPPSVEYMIAHVYMFMARSLQPTSYYSSQQDPAFTITDWTTSTGIRSARTLGVLDADE